MSRTRPSPVARHCATRVPPPHGPARPRVLSPRASLTHPHPSPAPPAFPPPFRAALCAARHPALGISTPRFDTPSAARPVAPHRRFTPALVSLVARPHVPATAARPRTRTRDTPSTAAAGPRRQACAGQPSGSRHADVSTANRRVTSHGPGPGCRPRTGEGGEATHAGPRRSSPWPLIPCWLWPDALLEPHSESGVPGARRVRRVWACGRERERRRAPRVALRLSLSAGPAEGRGARRGVCARLACLRLPRQETARLGWPLARRSAGDEKKAYMYDSIT